ncbi:ACT domain-containing protein [Corynebacterium kroppenstedtii]|uniref:ACT domain-containing protein n=1 Tax=Corynebacterium sp. PCR 32 TaxID=3351342 RepID=UPI00309D77F8
MIAIMTVTGLDHTGIIAAVSTRLAEVDANITNVSQTIMGEYFTMIVQVEFDENSQSLSALQEALKPVEKEQKLKIRLQSEAIFRAMHEL